MCINNPQKVRRKDRPKYRTAYKTLTESGCPIWYNHRVSKPYNVDGKWNKVEFENNHQKIKPNTAGFHLYLNRDEAEKQNYLSCCLVYKCEIRGVRFIGITGVRRAATVIATQFRVV